MIIHSLEWKDNKLYLLDQTRLPKTYIYMEYNDYLKVADAIKNLVVRGAPAIGIAAAYGMLLAYQNLSRDCQDIATIEKRFLYAADTMKMARPTAVNLFWAVDEMIKVFKIDGKDPIKNLKMYINQCPSSFHLVATLKQLTEPINKEEATKMFEKIKKEIII